MQLRVDEVYVPQCLQSWPKSVQVAKFPLIVPPGENLFLPWVFTHQGTLSSNLIKLSLGLTKPEAYEVYLPLFPPKVPFPPSFPSNLFSQVQSS